MANNRRPVSVDRLEKMGQLMQAKNEMTKESMGEQAPQYIFIQSEHFAIVKRKEGDKVVYIVSSPHMTNGKKDVSFCHEVLDPSFAHYAYPLMASQLKKDLGTLREFLSENKERMEHYRSLGRIAPPGKVDDLVSVRAILHAEKHKLPANDDGAKEALKAVTQEFSPSFEFKLTPDEKQQLNSRRALDI